MSSIWEIEKHRKSAKLPWRRNIKHSLWSLSFHFLLLLFTYTFQVEQCWLGRPLKAVYLQAVIFTFTFQFQNFTFNFYFSLLLFRLIALVGQGIEGSSVLTSCHINFPFSIFNFHFHFLRLLAFVGQRTYRRQCAFTFTLKFSPYIFTS